MFLHCYSLHDGETAPKVMAVNVYDDAGGWDNGNPEASIHICVSSKCSKVPHLWELPHATAKQTVYWDRRYITN